MDRQRASRQCEAPGCDNLHTRVSTCSDACRARLYRARKRKREFGYLAQWGTCYACGRVFFHKRRTKTYCSAHCRKSMSSGRHRVRPMSDIERMEADMLRRRKIDEIAAGTIGT